MLDQANLKFKRTGSAKESLDIGGIKLKGHWDNRRKEFEDKVYQIAEDQHSLWRNDLNSLLRGKIVAAKMTRLARTDEIKKIHTKKIKGTFKINVLRVTPLTHIRNTIPKETGESDPRIYLTADDGYMYEIDYLEKIYIK